MTTFLIIIHAIVCIALIMIVLLQTGKGADMGAAFGGGSSNTLFGSTGGSTFLGKMTTVAAIVFMITSLGLAYLSGHGIKNSIMTEKKAPIEQKAAPAEPEKSSHSEPENSQPAKPAQAQ
ncbi:MAG: preprotein translocase subunit SecG [Deltaproteobacteria bacterium]|nr:MAG: preprotein translocase subunit SecG [Deltaproteobacteria bacterium]